MSGIFRLARGAAGALAWVRTVYGPGYRRARRAAFLRSGGMCQFCGLVRAEEAHHWALRYPPDAEVTADDLTALCRFCHRLATFRRLFGRAQSGSWFIVAKPRPFVRGRRRVARHQPRRCLGPVPASASRPAARPPEPDLRALVERCHLVLVVACLACERYVRLDAVVSHLPRWRSMSLTQLRRRLCCCRCRSRARWVLLGGWPAGGTAASGGGHGRETERRAAGDGR